MLPSRFKHLIHLTVARVWRIVYQHISNPHRIGKTGKSRRTETERFRNTDSWRELHIYKKQHFQITWYHSNKKRTIGKKKLLRFSILSLNASDFVYHHLKTWLSPADRFITEGVWQKSLYCLCAQLLLGAYPSRLKSLRNKFDDDSLPISLVPESLEKIVFVEGNEGRFLDWGNGPKLPTSYIHIKVFYFFSFSDMQHEMLPVLHRFFWQFQKKSS